MAYEKTDSELRNEGVYPELFSVTPEMFEAMREARESRVGSEPSPCPPCPDEQSNFRPYDQEQRFFVEVSRKDFFDGTHAAHVVDRVVETLDLSEIYKDYSHEGNLAYHPKMMLKVLFYAYYIGVMSSRTIWDCVINRADFIYLAAGQVPNFRTINAFRLRHLSKLGSLFTQIVLLCVRLGMVGFEHMAVDGQKIKANASYSRSKNLKSMNKDYEKIKRGLQRLLDREVSEQAREKRDERAGKLEKKLEQLDEFRKHLETLEDPEKRVNMTDFDSAMMTHKGGMASPSYNHQSAVDERYGVTIAVQTSQHGDHGDDLNRSRTSAVNECRSDPSMDSFQGHRKDLRLALINERGICITTAPLFPTWSWGTGTGEREPSGASESAVEGVGSSSRRSTPSLVVSCVVHCCHIICSIG